MNNKKGSTSRKSSLSPVSPRLEGSIEALLKDYSSDDIVRGFQRFLSKHGVSAKHKSRKRTSSSVASHIDKKESKDATKVDADDQKSREDSFDISKVDEHVKAKAIRLFNIADKDESGTIDEYELRELLKELLGKVTEPEANRIYQEMDADHSGMISYDEFLQGFLRYQAQWNVTKVLEKRTSQLALDGDERKERKQQNQASLTATKFDWEIPRDQLQVIETLGSGSYGEVCKAKWRGMDVAVKTLFKKKAEDNVLEAFRSEVAIMGKLRHPNVLLFMGASTTDPENLVMVMEYLDGGNLSDYVRAEDYSVDVAQILRWARQAALGLNYLHICKILHRDLKPDNLMMDANLRVKLADFGLSALKSEDGDVREGGGRGTPLFLAPELLSSYYQKPRVFIYTESSDVYAYALTVWCMFGGDILLEDPNFEGVDSLKALKTRVVDENIRPCIPPECPDELTNMLRLCWDASPHRRRNCGQILADLERLLELTFMPWN